MEFKNVNSGDLGLESEEEKKAAEEKAEADIGVSLATRAAVPVTPPKTKLLGNLKKYTPTDMMEMLSVMRTYCLTYFITFSRRVISADVSINSLFLFPDQPNSFFVLWI